MELKRNSLLRIAGMWTSTHCKSNAVINYGSGIGCSFTCSVISKPVTFRLICFAPCNVSCYVSSYNNVKYSLNQNQNPLFLVEYKI